MNPLHKIFFVVVVVLSIAAGNSFNGFDVANGNRAASVIVSASREDLSYEKSSSAATIRPVAQNDSTTSNDAQSGQSEILRQNQNDDAKGALENDALLKTDSLSGPGAFRQIGFGESLAIQARSALVADLKTGKPYFELDPTLRRPIASLAKLMTAIVALEKMDSSHPVTLGEESLLNEDETSLNIALKPGNTYSSNDNLIAMLMISSNEAAEALANDYGRNEFMARMNALAAEFGMNSTNFSDSTGLSVANQSTASDLQKLALNVYRDYPKIFDITRKKSGIVTELNSKKRTTLSNINILAGTGGFIGGKTGYTKNTNGNLLSIFSYGGRPVLVIVLGTDDRFGDTNVLFQWFKDNFQKI
ncbi:MAG: serine hydrolase [Patescibacteria group bacterium]